MDIQILCPRCQSVLSDTFSAPSCKLSTCDRPLDYVLTMECVKCELDLDVNIKISTDRAQTVYSALRKAGIESPKMSYKGVGSSELLEGLDPRAAEHRRVTFKVIPTE